MEVPKEDNVAKQTVASVFLTDSTVIQSINHHLSEILGDDFIYLKHIGAGMSGNVYLCEYTGNDKLIKNLCDRNNWISVKILMNNQEIEHEAKIAQQLYDKKPVEQMQYKHNIGMPIRKNDKIIALVMQYIAYDDTPSAPQEDSLKSYLRKFYQAVVNGSVSEKAPTDKIHNALYNDYEIICAQLINEMHDIMYEFHLLGFLHLDIASRNFILNKPVFDNDGNIMKLTLTLCDYGHAAKMEKDGSAKTYRQRNCKPITARDYQDIVNHHATVSTDIFALKCAIIGIISMTVADLMHDYSVLDIGQQSLKKFKEMRVKNDFYRDDNKVLVAYLKKLSEYVNICPDAYIKQQAKEFISCYNEYIQAIPPDNQNLMNVHNLDRKALLTANVNFFESMLQKKVNNIESVEDRDSLNEFLLSVKRLMVLPLTDNFKNSKQYQEVKALDNIDKVKKYILLHRKMNNLTNNPQKENIAPFISGDSEQLKWVDGLNHAIIQWKQDHSALEIKWFGVSFENKVNGIINNIIQHKITSFTEANALLNTVEKEFSQKIEQKKLQPLIEFKSKNKPQDISPPTVLKSGYEIQKIKPKSTQK